MSNLFLFLDEAGDFTFNTHASQYLIFTCLSTTNPSAISRSLDEIRYNLFQEGYALERFHASEDKQAVRDRVFPVLSATTDFQLDVEVIEKKKTHPSLQSEKLYSKVYGILLNYVLHPDHVLNRRNLEKIEAVHIVCDTVPLKRKRQAMEGALKIEVSRVLTKRHIPYKVVFHSSAAHTYLQGVDYCGWAIFRKWERKDLRSYEFIGSKIKSEYNVFAHGGTDFY